MTKVNLDKLQAKSNGNIETVIAGTELGNGALVALGERKGREAMEAVAPSNTAELLLVAAPEVQYDETKDQLDTTTPAGKEVRAYHLTEGDLFQVEKALFDAPASVGDVVTGNADYGYTANVDSRTTFKVDAETKFGHDRRDMYLLRVLTV